LSEVRKLPYSDGLIDMDHFLDEFECEVPEDHHFQALDLALHLRWHDGGVRINITFLDGGIIEE